MEIRDKFSRYTWLLYDNIVVQFHLVYIVVEDSKNVCIIFYNGFTVSRVLVNSVVFFFLSSSFWLRSARYIFPITRMNTTSGGVKAMCTVVPSRILLILFLHIFIFLSLSLSTFFFFIEKQLRTDYVTTNLCHLSQTVVLPDA